MDCNKEEASREKKLAEVKMGAGDFAGAQKFVTKAQTLFPKVEPDQEIGAAKKRRKDDVEESSNKRRTKQEDPFAENLPVKPDHIDTKAQELAILWKGKIRIETPRSSLEVLAFLQFIVTFRLQNSIINQDETAQLASSVSHYKEAPTLFKSLGLDNMISEFVEELIDTCQYIPAAEDKDWGKLRDILELMSDYNLKIVMPGDLIVKLMDQPSTSNLAG
ncbi:hypothetical protein ARALYDRAFT_340367 [Arabidopsis lyrata subsp. lyrata]|uniref:FRIGIDA-like protein n=1 Tax=Arabidopsis lyrata subsp. lyrata TaxID=81972 RepID=D7KZE6_ARALL|nr:hypothetical protein ARALYDRAFT_340367 [Arabidopsis lyrata subsp. lyrata]